MFPVGSLFPSHPKNEDVGHPLIIWEIPSPRQAQGRGDFRILHVFGVSFSEFRNSLLQVRGGWAHAGGLPKLLGFSTDCGDMFPIFWECS